MSQTQDASRPDYVRPELSEALPDLRLIEDLLAGTRRMWAMAKKRGYIRQWKDEDEAVYKIRKESETVHEGLGRTLSASTGMLFAKPPQIEWNAGEQRMQAHWSNLDMAGTAGHVFVKRFSEMGIQEGIALLLVDHAKRPEGIMIHDGNEEALGLRPKWSAYPRSAVLSWLTQEIGNEEIVVQVVLAESALEREGAFGVTPVKRYRVLSLGAFQVEGQREEAGATWTLWQEDDTVVTGDVPGHRVVGQGVFRNRAGEPAPFLPIAIAYTGRKLGTMQAHPPLMGVAWANLAHWRSSTNLEFYRQLCAFPQPTVIGALIKQEGADGIARESTLRVGPMVVVQVEAGGDYRWTELSGTSMERLEHGVTEKERHMGQLGMSFLAPDTRAAETAEAKRLDATAENATLATAAQGIDDAVNLAMQHHGWYLGIAPNQVPVFTLNRDFDNTAMDPDTMRAYVDAVQRAGLPARMLLEAWQQGGRIGPDVDLDELEMEMMAGQQAREEAEAMERAERVEEMKATGQAA